MNEKLKELVLRIVGIAGAAEDYKSFQDSVAKLIQQYADEQSLGFSRWCVRNSYPVSLINGKWFKDGKNITDQELLTRYHESQKP